MGWSAMEVKSERNSAERLEASREGGHQDAFSNQVRTINLALQGGGAHGAFTWGVLDRLLDEKDLGGEWIGATSAGAMNAAAFAYVLAVNGREGARSARRLLEARQRRDQAGAAAAKSLRPNARGS